MYLFKMFCMKNYGVYTHSMIKPFYHIHHFSTDKEKFQGHEGFNLTRSVIFHINPFHVPSGRVGILLQNLSTEWCGFESRYWLFTYHFLFELNMPFFYWFGNQYFCCNFKVVLLMSFNNKHTIHIEYILKRKWDLRWIMVLISYFDLSYS